MVHCAIMDEGPGVSPLCGAWGESASWTLVREAVSCPHCLQRLRASEEALGTAPVSRARPPSSRFTPLPTVVRSPYGNGRTSR